MGRRPKTALHKKGLGVKLGQKGAVRGPEYGAKEDQVGNQNAPQQECPESGREGRKRHIMDGEGGGQESPIGKERKGGGGGVRPSDINKVKSRG